MKGKKTKTSQDGAFSEAEWRAFGRSFSQGRGEEPGKLPERIAELGLERLIRLTSHLNCDPRERALYETVAKRILSRVLLLPDAKWRRFLLLITKPIGKGAPQTGGVHVKGERGLKSKLTEAEIRRVESLLVSRPKGETQQDALLRIAGTSELAKSLQYAISWKRYPRKRKSVR